MKRGVAVKKNLWWAFAYLFLISSLDALSSHEAIKIGADPVFRSVARVLIPGEHSTATLMQVDGNPFFLTSRHSVCRRDEICIETDEGPVFASSVQAFKRDLALVFPKTPISSRLMEAAISVENITTVFSGINMGVVPTNRWNSKTQSFSLGSCSVLSVYGAGFGAPIVSWCDGFGLLDGETPVEKNAFSMRLAGMGSICFQETENGILYDLSKPHDLYYRGNPNKGFLSRPLSPGFSGSIVFNHEHRPIGVVAGVIAAAPTGATLTHLRGIFGKEAFPWKKGPVRSYPLMSKVVHENMVTTVIPLFPEKEDITLRAQLYYDAL